MIDSVNGEGVLSISHQQLLICKLCELPSNHSGRI